MRELPSLFKPEIDSIQLVRYAGASGDFNPIHTVESIAKQAGLGGVIAHGMLVMGFAGEALSTWFPRQKVKRFKVRFTAMTRPEEALTVEGNITGETASGEDGGYLGEVTVKNQAGEVKLLGSFEVDK